MILQILKTPKTLSSSDGPLKESGNFLLTYDGEVNRHKTTHPREEKRPQLFNLLKDPKEENNLAEQNPDVVAKLVANIDNWWPVKERKVVKKWE